MPNARTIPSARNQDLVTYTIKIDGEEISSTYQVLSVIVSREINRIPFAQIIFVDGDPSLEDFKASNEALFIPGKEIEIHAGYHSEENLLFKGIIVEHNLKIRNSSSRLYIECKDAFFKTTINRKNKYFAEVTDSDAIEEIIGTYNLDKDIEATTVNHQELVQFHTTDWDFILCRSEVNGKICFVEDGQLIIKAPVIESPVLSLQYGATILEFDAEMDGRLQHSGIKTYSWDAANQEQLEVEAQEPGIEELGNMEANTLGSNLELEAFEMRHSGKISQEELQAWADSKLLKNRMAKIRGRVKFQGFGEVKPGHTVELNGLGDRFSGKVFVSGVQHQITDGTWMTNIQFGLDDSWSAQKYEMTQAPASLLLPAIHGLQVGIVTQLEEDPEGEERIQVRIPIIDSEAEGVWARLACLDAGENRGTFFRPEVNDEVIVGFINGDPRDAIVLGMLHSSAKPSPMPITADNHEKGYISREEIKMIFDDDKLKYSIETPGGNSLMLDEDQGGIFLEDENGNKITMNSDGITLESAKDIILKATGDIKMEGNNIEAKANIAFNAEGSATAEISAGGTTTVKGGLVQIN